MMIFTIQNTKVEFFSNLCTTQNSSKKVHSIIGLKFSTKLKIFNGWTIMEQRGFSKVLRMAFLIFKNELNVTI